MAGVRKKLAGFRAQQAEVVCAVCKVTYRGKSFEADGVDVCSAQCRQSHFEAVQRKKESFERQLEERRQQQAAVLAADPSRTPAKSPKRRRIEYALMALLWVLLFALAVKIEMGAVFLIFSAFYGIYASLDDRKRRSGELSAYSVFNPNLEKIDGTLDASQFEKELRYGPGTT